MRWQESVCATSRPFGVRVLFGWNEMNSGQPLPTRKEPRQSVRHQMANSARPQGHHDQLVAKFFEDTTLAQELLRQFLPAEPLEQFHLEGLEPIKNSFVDEELRRSYCDLCRFSR